MSAKTIKLNTDKCFNCGEAPVYHKDTSMGVNCSDCKPGQMCDNCTEDAEFPHVVSHQATGCPFGFIARHTSKSRAVKLWRDEQSKNQGKKMLLMR